MKALLASLLSAAFLFTVAPALAAGDKVAVLPLSSPNNVSRPELEQLRQATREAVQRTGHTFATPDELVSAEMAIHDGVADTSQEHIAAGKLAHAEWTVTARVERIDYPSAKMPNGTTEEGYTTYKLEVEACQIASGRVESLSREIILDDAAAMIGDVLALLVRPEGLANADIPWEHADAPRPKPKPKAPAPPPPPAPETPKPPPPPAEPRPVYGAGAPFAIAFAMGATEAAVTPSVGRGPTTAMTVGGSLGYALPDAVPGLELRANVLGQVAGPKAVEVSGGARWAFAPVRGVRLFVGPEAMLGVHVAAGADKTARFLAHGSAFVAYGITTNVQIEAAADLAGAFGGVGSLLLVGGTGRASLRF